MAKFAYNNAKNANTGHMFFELNCGYHFCVSFKEDTNPCFQSKPANELSVKLQDLMTIYQENLHHTQEFQKQAYNNDVKPRNYASTDKV